MRVNPDLLEKMKILAHDQHVQQFLEMLVEQLEAEVGDLTGELITLSFQHPHFTALFAATQSRIEQAVEMAAFIRSITPTPEAK
jgi:hypothetical protein